MVEKTDERDITRPGHRLTYTITVRNTGEGKIGDIEVVDAVPSALKIQDVFGDAAVSGQRVSWGEFALSEGEEVTFTITAIVKDGTANGHVLTNTVKARSEDEGLSATDTDTTVVETAVVTQPAGAVAAAGPQPVPVTARTGAGLFGWLGALLIWPVLALFSLAA